MKFYFVVLRTIFGWFLKLVKYSTKLVLFSMLLIFGRKVHVNLNITKLFSYFCNFNIYFE